MQRIVNDPAVEQASYGKLTWVGILLGLGFGGFFDGIVSHQLLQWHHLLSRAGFPPNSVQNLQVNTLADGAFHALTYVFTAAGLLMLWRALSLLRGRGAGWYLIGAMSQTGTVHGLWKTQSFTCTS